MKRTALILYLIAAALSVRADYGTLPVETDEAMGEFIRFESRTWAAEMSGEGGRLAASTTWTDEHVILNDVYVPSGVTLTLDPGAKVKFCTGTRIKVEDGGAIVLNGAEGEEVVLTGYAEDTTFAGVVLQSSSASYSDNGYVVANGFAFGKFATVNLNDTTAFVAGGQAIIPVSVSGSRESEFSFDWVAETNGVAFASGSMSWSRVGDGTKNIIVPFGSEFAALSNFTVRASLLRCCNASKPESIVTLSEFITSDIQTDEAMGDFIRFESREWATNFEGMPNTEGGRLAANTVWSNEHVIVSSVYIPSGVTFTLTADTVVRFCEGTMIKIEDGGKLEIVGADGHDVILRGYENDTKYTGIVKMSSGTLTDNSYVRVDGFTLGTLANVALNNSSSFRSSGLALIPVTVSGSRDSSFSLDWVAETNGAPYKSGTMLWTRVSDGTKNISINYGAELDGLDKFTIRVAVHRACYANPDSCEVKISDFIVADIQTDEAMGNFIRFESRDWTTNFADVANAEGGRLAANTTWTGEHVILGDVYIPSGVTLTLAADALVRFCEGTMIKIEDGGALNVVGAEGHDVILRNYDVGTTSRGIVKMSSGTYTDNMYVQYPDFRYGNYPDITLHDAGVGRDAGKIYIPITLGGTTRNQSFNVDWETDKGASGTISWSKSDDGTKWIEIPVDAATFGGTETYGIRLTAARGANLAVANAKVTIYEFNHPVTETVSLTEGTEPSNEFAVNGDIREQPIFLNAVEPVRYSGKWQAFDANEAAKLRVSIESDNGVKVLKEAGVDETGEFAFRPEDYPVGHYMLKHEIVDKVGDPLASMSKAFSVVDREDVVMHGGTLSSNEIWKAGMTHVVCAPVSVPSIYTLFIEPGAIVKFLTGTGIDLQTGAALFANAIVFTHIDDDTVGGDTLSDGYTVAPPMDAYYLTGNFTFGDDAELRNITQKTALTGTLNGNKMLSKGSTYRVSGTFTIANGAKLTIPAGTILKMEAGAQITVASGGMLTANGTRAAPIVFTSIKDDSYSGDTNGDGDKTFAQPGDWKRIEVAGTAAFDYTRISFASDTSDKGALQGAGGTITFNNGIVESMKYECVRMNSGSFVSYNSVFRDAAMGFGYYGGSGTYVYNGVIADCSIACRASNKHFFNTIFYNCITFLESTASTCDHCLFFNPEGYGAASAVQVGSNCNIWGDPLFIDPENGDFRIVEGSPCVDAADSSVAPELDFYGQPRITLTEQTNDVPVVQGQLADVGICEVMPRDVTSDIDLQPVSVRAEEKATPGQLIFVKWTVSNVGGVEVDGSWRDTISLVSENGQQVVLGDKITTSHIAVGGEVFCSAYFTVPAMAEGKWRLKVNVNSYHDIFEGSLFANNALVSDRTVEISLPSIDPAQGATDGVVNAGVPKVLKLTFAAGEENRMVHLDVSAGVKVAYGFGFMPRGNAATGSIIAGDAGVRFRVPEDATDVYVTLESDETATYELSYSKDKIVIASVTPGTLPSSGQVTVMITGAGFVPSNTVELVGGGKSVAPESVQYVDAGTLVTTVDCTELAAGTSYDLQVGDGETEVIAANAVSVAAVQGKGEFWARLVVPDSVRQGRKVTCYVEYGNSGTADLLAPVLQVSIEGDGNLMYLHELAKLRALQYIAGGQSPAYGVLPAGCSNRIAFEYVAGAKGTLCLHTSVAQKFCPPSWSTADQYLQDLSMAATTVGARHGDATDYWTVLAVANALREGRLTAAVHGALSDAQGEPCGLVLVRLVGTQADVSVLSDENGRYIFEAVVDGDYDIVVEALGVTRDITVQGQRDVTCDILAAVAVEACVSGRIEGLAAGALAEIRAWPIAFSGEKRQTLASADGTFALHGLDEGDYCIECEVDGVKWRKTVTIGLGHDTSIVLSQPMSFPVGGRVISNGVDSGSGYVMAMNKSDCCTYFAEIDAAMVFSFEALPAGDYDFTAFYGGNVYESQVSVAKDMSSVLLSEMLTISDQMKKTLSGGVKLVVFSKEYSDWDEFWGLYAEYASWPIQKIVDWIAEESDERRQIKELNHEALRLLAINTVERPSADLCCKHNMQKYADDLRVYNTFKLLQINIDRAYKQSDPLLPFAEASKLVSSLGDVAIDLYFSKNIDKLTKWKKFALDALLELKEVLQISGELQEMTDEQRQIVDLVGELQKLAFTATDLTHSVYKTFDLILKIKPLIEKHKNLKHFKTELAVLEFLQFCETLCGLKNDAKNTVESVVTWWLSRSSLEDLLSNARAKKSEFESKLPFNRYEQHCCDEPYPDPPYDPSIDLSTPSVPQSCDPNEMVGPRGKGDPETDRFVKPGEWMTYTVYFENKSDATAAAQEVTVTNPLSEWLDWSTFEMGEVAFNNQIDLGLVGKKNGTSEVTMNGTSYSVRTELKLDEKAGVADWYLRIVDPNTETGWPEDVFAGFLPPNDETFRGEGHLTYRIKVREDAPKGVRIDNSATIVFDYNPPIETDPAWWNMVGQPGPDVPWSEDEAFSANAANTYEGFLWDEKGELVGIVQVKTTKQSVKTTTDKKTKVKTVTTNITATAAVTDANGKKWSYTKGVVTVEGVVTDLRCTAKGCPVAEFGVKVGRNGMEGVWGEYAIFGARNGMGTKGDAMMAALEAYKGKWSVSLRTSGEDAAGTVRLQLDVQAKGVVKIAGNWESGAKVSATAQLVMGDGFAYVPVLVKSTKTSPALNALLRIDTGGEVALLSEGELVGGGRTVAALEILEYLAENPVKAGAAYVGRVALNELAYPAKFTQKGLPTGLKLDAATGVVSGAPTKPGEYVVTFTATSSMNSKAKDTVNVTIKVENYVDGLIPVEDHYGPYTPGVSYTVTIPAADGCTVSGMPTGMKWTAKDVKAKDGTVTTPANSVYGIPTKPGKYTVCFKKSVSELNEKGKSVKVTHTATATFEVADYPAITLLPSLAIAGSEPMPLAEGAALSFFVGVKQSFAIDLAGTLDGVDTTVAAKGLPTGLKLVKKTIYVDPTAKKKVVDHCEYVIEGVPTKASSVDKKKNVVPSHVTLTASNKYKWSGTFAFDITVVALPTWAYGTFNGGNTNGIATLTVSNAGKISGKWMSEGLTWTLSAASFDAYDAEREAYHATVTAKSGKETKTLELVHKDGYICASLTSGKDSASPLWEAWRNGWKEEAQKTLATKLKGKKVQVGEVVLTVGASGAVTAKGTFVTGFDEKKQKDITYSASCSTVLIPTAEAGLYRVYLYFPPKSGKFDGFADVVEIGLGDD